MKDVNLGYERIGKTNINNKGSSMKVIEYITKGDIIVEFQDEYKARVHTSWSMFDKGLVKNPYIPSVYNIGIKGNKYPSKINQKYTEEYRKWQNMLSRCYDKRFKESYAYKDVTCCEEWLLYENFYEWLHSQENYNQWISSNDRWSLDKDILVKGNKIYSPNVCSLVPEKVNNLFIRKKSSRGELPIGVSKQGKYYASDCNGKYVGLSKTPEEAFEIYKIKKEESIKQIAQEEYDKGNITKRCYNAMMNYEVEITD